MVKITYTARAVKDLKNIHSFISFDSSLYAKNFVAALRQKITGLKLHPDFGKPFYPNKYTVLRQLLHKAYRIIYHYEKDVVIVISIHHQSRLPENIEELKSFEK